jgi:hypothetical protein
VCPRCGGLHGSEARYCPSCGVAFRGALAIAEVGEAVSIPGEVAAPQHTEPEPQPATTHVAEGEAAKAEPGPQPTEIMPPVDGDGEATRFAHPGSERSQQ